MVLDTFAGTAGGRTGAEMLSHKEASDSWELALSSKDMLGGELPATTGILTGLDATGGDSTLGMP